MTEKKKTEAKKPAPTQRFSDVAKELGLEVKALLALVDQFVIARPDYKDYVYTDGKKPAASRNPSSPPPRPPRLRSRPSRPSLLSPNSVRRLR